jgi:beta-xylosidase
MTAWSLPTVAIPILQGDDGKELLDWGDQGNGTYINPVLNADYSDPDVIRVGSKYYMVASDFHWLGMQVLESADLVNWQLISQVYRHMDFPGWDANTHYAGGAWAPAIRYHDGRFWIYVCTPDEGLLMSTATDPRGPWEPLYCVKSIEKWEDPCPFWDDDGQAYLGRSRHRAGPIIVHKMSADGRQLLDDGVTVYTGPVAEGTKFLKRNGYYYLIIPEGGVSTGWQTVLRSRNIYGPYEKKVVLEQGITDVNGPHQGALVDTPDGQWWFLHFQSTTPNGRVLHLQPARWKDDWPLIGVDIDGNGIGEPVRVWTKPCTRTNSSFTVHCSTSSLPATSDDFNTTQLGLQWQWCHNPVDSHWSLTERKGFLTFHPLQADSLKLCRSLLTQKVMGYESEATLLLQASQTSGLRTGLAFTGKIFCGIGLSDEGIYTEEGGRYKLVKACKTSRVWVRVIIDSRRNRHQFLYSLDGKHYVAVGETFTMREGYWKGIRVGLYAYTTNDSPATVHFDDFQYKITK